jgi:uncharacterized membrane protein YfcA
MQSRWRDQRTNAPSRCARRARDNVENVSGLAAVPIDGDTDVKVAVLALLACVSAAFAWMWIAALRATGLRAARPSLFEVFVGAVTDFFDTLGIGSFAPTTALFKARDIVPARLIPGTLNVGHTAPTLVQAFVYITVVRIDPWTLALMIAASAFGAWVGAGVVVSWPKRRIQRGLGLALLAAAGLLFAQQLHLLPAGGTALALRGGHLALAVACNLFLGAWMTLGVGLYGPCMVLISLLGMNPIAAFPIMMGSCAFLMPVASARFLSHRAYAPPAAVGLTVGGVPAVVVAALLVRSLPLDAVRWLVIAAVLVAASTILRSSRSAAQSE